MGEAASTTNVHLHSGAILNAQIHEATIQPSIHYYHYSTGTRQNHLDIDMASRQAIFSFLTTAMINLQQLLFQGKPESPFGTHPATMLLAVVSLFVYCLSYDAKLRFRLSLLTTGRFVHVSMTVFGPLSLAAMASVLFPVLSCLFLFPGALFYSLWQFQHVLPGFRKAWDWLILAIKNTFCNQESRSRRVSLPNDHVEIGIRFPI